jgi:hypothetical protein
MEGWGLATFHPSHKNWLLAVRFKLALKVLHPVRRQRLNLDRSP